jgi:hypothetical protein
MKLEEALVHLRQGKAIRRKGWKAWCRLEKHSNGWTVYGQTHSDIATGLLADDWELYKEVGK